MGRLTGLSNDNSEATSWTYQDNGWLNTKTLGNGVVTTYTRDQQGRLRDLANKTGGGATLSDFAVPATGGYDGTGNRLSVTATVSNAPAAYSGTTSYAYDYSQTANPQLNRSQVTGETSTRGGSYTNAFGYDGGTAGGPGNPTSFKGATNTFNSDNQVTNTGYGYDGNGSPTTYKGAALTFDPENRLTAYASTQTDGCSADDLRAWKQSSTGRTYFLYDGDQPVCEFNGAGTLTATHTFGADGLLSRRSVTGTPATTFYTFDEHGNVAQRLNGSAGVQSSDLYDSYGSRTGTVSQPDPWGYEAQAGYYADVETGLLLLMHRFYDPSTGRFLTRDPIGYGGGINLYGYTGNNPVNREDPDGTLAPNPAPVLEVIEGVAEDSVEVGIGIVGVGVGVGVLIGVGILIIGAGPAGPRNEYGPEHYDGAEHTSTKNGKKNKGKHERKRPGAPEDKDERMTCPPPKKKGGKAMGPPKEPKPPMRDKGPKQ